MPYQSIRWRRSTYVIKSYLTVLQILTCTLFGDLCRRLNLEEIDRNEISYGGMRL